jgi:DHA1 family tetracycline resistance protein-like MFS transporter
MKWIEGWYSSYALLGAVAAGLIPILLPLLVTRTGSATQLGLVMGAFSLGGLTAPAWGHLADSHRAHRPLLAGGLLALAAGTALFALARSFPAWSGLALLQGVGFAAASTVANLFVVETKPRAEWDARIGWLQAFYGGGQVVGLLLAGALGQRAPKAGILLAAGLAAVAVIPALASAPRLPKASLARRPPLSHPVRHAEWPSSSPQRLYHHLNLRSIRWFGASGSGRLVLFLLAWLLSYGGSAAFFSLYPVLMRQVYGVSPGLSSLAFAVSAGAGLGLYAPAGRWSSLRGPRPVLRTALAVRLGAFLVLYGLARLSAAFRGLPAMGAFLLIVLAWSALSVAGTALVARLSPENEGEGMGIFNAVTAFAGVLGAVAGGWTASLQGYAAVPVVGLAGVAAGLIMMIFLVGGTEEVAR